MIPQTEQKEKIAVWIFGFEASPEGIVDPILLGLEEEGIPAEFRQVSSDGAEKLAKLAADGSPLNVGIGINGAERAVALHHRDLPGAVPLFMVRAPDLNPVQLRLLGTNAARLVKGEPLAFQEQPAFSTEFPGATEVSEDTLNEIAALVLANILRNRNEG